MCGIIARIGEGSTVDKLVTGLENLEYRGYDSAGIAVQNGVGIKLHKQSGRVADLKETVDSTHFTGNLGIGHTRWSTHGPPTDENAHPHTDSSNTVAVVHNGVIENYDALRSQLQGAGVTFTSETDTEVIPHLFEHYLDDGLAPEDAFRATIEDLEGNFAIAAIVDGDERVYAARDGSPLVIGFGTNERYLASDVPAFLEFTDRVMYLEDGDVVVAGPSSLQVSDLDGNRVDREVETVDWDSEETGRGTFDHYMLKEIHSQPTALRNTIEGRIDFERGAIDLDAVAEQDLSSIRSVQLIGCGTSYHAALFGKTILKRADIQTEAIRANEYEIEAGPIDENTLVIAVTQSGETADTLGALEIANENGARTLAVTNVVGSSVTRSADDSVFIRAGPEIGVAATKTYSSQAVTLTLLANHLAETMPTAAFPWDFDALFQSLTDLPDAIETVLESSRASELATRYYDREAYFFIGRGLGNSVAKEGALKFKEITYEHAEGFAAGELKHGPLALVTPETPVFALLTGDEKQDQKTVQNAIESHARGAPIVVVAPETATMDESVDAVLDVPDIHPVWAALLVNVQLQLIAYHAAVQLDRPIDKPRNLAKSVTVE